MITPLSPENPLGPTRLGFAWEKIPPGSSGHLDIGCNDGRFLDALAAKGVAGLTGVDADRGAIERGREKFPDLDLRHLSGGEDLPFADGSFASVSLLDVLEHVDQQERLLTEIARVLHPGGRLVVTVPGQHLFSVLDMGNFKFRFPRLHRWWYVRGHGREAYQQRYGANPDGLIGDISAAKAWHEHFSRPKLAELLGRTGFEVETFDGAGLFVRPLMMLTWPLWQMHIGRNQRVRLLQADGRRFDRTNLFCLARKAEEAD